MSHVNMIRRPAGLALAEGLRRRRQGEAKEGELKSECLVFFPRQVPREIPPFDAEARMWAVVVRKDERPRSRSPPVALEVAAAEGFADIDSRELLGVADGTVSSRYPTSSGPERRP